MEVILRTKSEDIELRELDACERLTLRKFGIVLLRREFSTTSSDESPVLHNCPAYAVQLVMAMAIIMVKKFGRSKDSSKTIAPSSKEHWQIFEAGSLIFDGLQIDLKAIDSYLDLIATTSSDKTSLESLPLPRALDAYLKMRHPNQTGLLPINLRLMLLACVIVVMASVSGMGAFADLPILANLNVNQGSFVSSVQKTKGTILYDPAGLWHPFCRMLVGPHFTTEDSAMNANNFMVSDFGWTVYLPSFGDHDPASTNPERLFVRKGVPTDRKIGEQKLRVRDVANLADFYEMMPC